MKRFSQLVIIAAMAAAACKKKDNTTTYQLNENTSKVEWKGSAPDHFHIGSFDAEGSLQTNGKGVIRSGKFVIPISSIQNFDLPDTLRQTLLDDLKSDHFFNMIVHPNASFQITKVESYTSNDTTAIQGANYLLTGNFTLIGQTHPISFPAKITISGDSLTAEAKLSIDRTKWGMKIYSDPNAPLYILPDVNLHISLHADNANN